MKYEIYTAVTACSLSAFLLGAWCGILWLIGKSK